MMISTAWATSHLSVLMCRSGDSGGSYGADIPVKSTCENLSAAEH